MVRAITCALRPPSPDGQKKDQHREKGTVGAPSRQHAVNRLPHLLKVTIGYSARRPTHLMKKLDSLDSGGSDSDSTLDKTVTR